MADEKKDLGTRVRGHWSRLRTFIHRDLWLHTPQERGPRALYRLLRMGVLIVEGFAKSEVFLLAAALTYQVAFAMVPLLVVMLALLKGFGGLDTAEGKVQEFILRNMTPEAGGQVVTQFNAFIKNVNATAIGVIGFAALLYTSLSLLITIEGAFNKIWGIKVPRTLMRRFTVYWTFLTVSPLLLAASLSMRTYLTSSDLSKWLTSHIPFFGAATLFLMPFVMAWIMFAGFYMIMPNTRVRPGAAFIGALVSGTAWEALKTGYVWYNSHFAAAEKFAKFYGSLGAIPIFLLWIYISWIIVLFGAEVAFAAQHVGTYKREIAQLRLSAADRDRLSLVVTVAIVRDFVKGEPPPTGEEVAARMNSPIRPVNEVLYELSAQKVLREVAIQGRKEPGFVPARDPGVMTARDVLAAVRSYGDPASLPEGPAAAELYRLVNEAEGQATGMLARYTLRELAIEADESRIATQESGPVGEPGIPSAPGSQPT